MSTFWIILLWIYVYIVVNNIFAKLMRLALGIEKEHKDIYDRLVRRIGAGTALLIGFFGMIMTFVMVYILTTIITTQIGV